MKTATVIIPTYNERGIIKTTIEELQQVFKQIDDWKMQILVVDDTSPDKTYELVQALQEQWNNLHLLINKQKAGLGAAYLKGMDYSFKQLDSDVVFEFDADLSHNPSKIPAMLAKINQGCDLVIGSRYIEGGSIPQDWGFHRKLLSQLGNLVIRVILTNFSVADWTSGFRAIKKKVYQQISPEMRDERFSGYTFQVGFLHKAVKKNFKIAEVPFHFRDRTVGKSKLGPEFIINNMMYLLKVRLRDLLEWRIFRFVVVGGVGALIQFTSEELLRSAFSYLLAHFLAIEVVVASNFVLSNIWTFADRKLKPAQIPFKFLQFNLSSAGSILIQMIIGYVGARFIGIMDLFVLPVINFSVDSGLVFTAVGILIGMFWNFFAYNFFIWKKK